MASLHDEFKKSEKKTTHYPERNLVHLADKLVDFVLTVTKITTLDEVLELPGAETTSGG